MHSESWGQVINPSSSGSSGIIFPQVDTAAEAAAAVEKVRYAYGNGTRSLSPLALVDGDSITAPPGWTPETIADRNIAVICQIESTVRVFLFIAILGQCNLQIELRGREY